MSVRLDVESSVFFCGSSLMLVHSTDHCRNADFFLDYRTSSFLFFFF